MRIRVTTKYRKYPLSAELTEKSKRVATYARPLYGFFLGMLPGIITTMLFPYSILPPILGLAGVLIGPVLMVFYRDKKFEEFDAAYEQIIREIKESGISLFDYTKSKLSPSAQNFCDQNADNIPVIQHYLSQLTMNGMISELEQDILLSGYLDMFQKHINDHA